MKLLLNNSKLKSLLNYSSLLVVILLLLSSCAKEPGKIGFVIQPEDSKLIVGFSDTTTIYGFSELIDSIRSDKLNVNAFGSLRDPVFGGTTAGIYTQFILSVNGHDFGEDRQLDSLVLTLAYQGYYGDTTTTLTAHTYEMMSKIDKDSVYYSNLQLPVSATDYSNYSFLPKPNDSLVLLPSNDTIAPMLWLNLSDNSTVLGNKLLNATEADMEDSDAFQEFFYGLFVQSQPVYDDGTMLYFGLASANSKLTIYYSNSEQDSLKFDYLVTTSTATVNKYEHNYNSADALFQSQVILGDTMLGAQQLYAQGYGGVQSIIKLPYLNKWARRKNVAINEAKLVLPGISTDEFFGAPSQMYLLEIGEDGKGVSLPDQFEGDRYFDGSYNESSNSYEFRITRYVQSLISDTTQANNGLYLFLYGGSIHPERFIFKGNEQTSDSSSHMKLEILYTDL